MNKLINILLVVATLLPATAKSQSFERLWATGTAVPQGTVELTRRPDGLFRFAGALNAGELKIMTTETVVKGTTQYLKPYYVDSYLINNGLRYSVTSDESQPGWVVSFQEDTYRFLVDPVRRTVSGELMLPWNELLLAGSAFPGGSDNVEWNRNAMQPFQRDHDNPYVFTWTGELGIYDDVVEPGRFKLEGQMTWGPRELHPFVQDEDILAAGPLRQGGDDTKWHVFTPGTYRITVNLFFETIHAELLTPAHGVAPTGIATIADDQAAAAAIYNLNGVRQPQLRRGINLVRTRDGKVKKVLFLGEN